MYPIVAHITIFVYLLRFLDDTPFAVLVYTPCKILKWSSILKLCLFFVSGDF